jgi:hypothetical protein
MSDVAVNAAAYCVVADWAVDPDAVVWVCASSIKQSPEELRAGRARLAAGSIG